MFAHASQAFSIAHCTDSEDLLNLILKPNIIWDAKLVEVVEAFVRCGAKTEESSEMYGKIPSAVEQLSI